MMGRKMEEQEGGEEGLLVGVRSQMEENEWSREREGHVKEIDRPVRCNKTPLEVPCVPT